MKFVEKKVLEIIGKTITERECGGYCYAQKVRLEDEGITVVRSGSKKYIKDLKVGDVIDR